MKIPDTMALNKLFGGKADLSNIWGGIPPESKQRNVVRPPQYVSRCALGKHEQQTGLQSGLRLHCAPQLTTGIPHRRETGSSNAQEGATYILLASDLRHPYVPGRLHMCPF